MADHCYFHLLGAMDCLWFHQTVLFPDPISILCTKNLIKTTQSIPETTTTTTTSLSSSDLSLAPLLEEEITSDSSPNYDENPSRMNSMITSETHSNSSSPKTKKPAKHLRWYSGAVRRLRRTMSCKSLGELEYEEVKGFMDLGFEFKKEHLSPRMMSVIPGLQRLHEVDQFMDYAMKEANQEDEVIDIEDHEEERAVTRPYLSEAWLIKRPDCPLLNLRLPPASAVSDMKKHLQFWARTVASVIQQE